MPEPLQAAAWTVKRFADAQGLVALHDRKAHTTPKRAADYAALTGFFANATGTFRGDYGSGAVWLAWGEHT